MAMGYGVIKIAEDTCTIHFHDNFAPLTHTTIS